MDIPRTDIVSRLELGSREESLVEREISKLTALSSYEQMYTQFIIREYEIDTVFADGNLVTFST